MDISFKMSVSGEVRKAPRKWRKHKEKDPKSFDFRSLGGDKRDRTADLLNAMEERVHNYEYLCTKWSKQSIILR